MATKSHIAKNYFAKRIKRLLIDADLSVAEVARQIDRPRQSVSTAIHTKRFPKVREELTTFLNA